MDSNGWLLAVLVTAASVQDRDGGHRLVALLRERFSTITLVWADGGYAGRLVAWAAAVLAVTVTVVKRSDNLRGFVVLPRRWVVERSFGWLNRHRRLVRDYERLPEHHEAMVLWATTMIMTRQLVRQRTGQPPEPRWGTERTKPQSAAERSTSSMNTVHEQALSAQLAEIGVQPKDIELFSVSHSHPDHVGNANLFADATWIVDRDERDYMFSPEARAITQEFTAYERLETARTTLIEGDGDHDVFGDGAVKISSSAGPHARPHRTARHAQQWAGAVGGRHVASRGEPRCPAGPGLQHRSPANPRQHGQDRASHLTDPGPRRPAARPGGLRVAAAVPGAAAVVDHNRPAGRVTARPASGTRSRPATAATPGVSAAGHDEIL